LGPFNIARARSRSCLPPAEAAEGRRTSAARRCTRCRTGVRVRLHKRVLQAGCGRVPATHSLAGCSMPLRQVRPAGASPGSGWSPACRGQHASRLPCTRRTACLRGVIWSVLAGDLQNCGHRLRRSRAPQRPRSARRAAAGTRLGVRVHQVTDHVGDLGRGATARQALAAEGAGAAAAHAHIGLSRPPQCRRGL
jgi:hypothetical protein